jgi:hypothetical protein
MIKSYCDVIEALLPPADRPDELKALLPPIDSPYCVDSLNPAETAALEEALGDCFGSRGFGSTKCDELENGLLRFSLFRTDSHPAGVFRLADFPTKFKMGGLWLFFKNQRDRYCEYSAREEPGYGTSIADIIVRGWEFKKPWYEYHAVQLLERIAGERVSGWHLAWCGQLGRLVDQYYWRFRFEKAAIAGVGMQKGASLGGKIKSARYKPQQQEWQRLAADIWGRKPELSKLAVAKIIVAKINKIHPGEAPTAKNIARYITPL